MRPGRSARPTLPRHGGTKPSAFPDKADPRPWESPGIGAERGLYHEDRVRLLSLREMAALPLPEWRIYRLLHGITLLWAGPGSYKTFIAISWAVAVASGRPWFGRRVKQGSVVFIVGEGGLRAFQIRVSAAAAALGLSEKKALDLPIFGTEGAVNLSSWGGSEAQRLHTLVMERTRRHGRIGLFFVDTVSRCMPGKENDQDVMQAFVGTLDEVHDEWGCDIVAIHHANAEGDRPRGSTVLTGAVDGDLEVRVSAPDSEKRVPILIRANKIKEGEAGDMARLFALQVPVTVEGGDPLLDEENNPVTTCCLAADRHGANSQQHADQQLLKAIPKDGISACNLTRTLRRNKGNTLRDLKRLARDGVLRKEGDGRKTLWLLAGSFGSEPVSTSSEPVAGLGSTGPGSRNPGRKPKPAPNKLASPAVPRRASLRPNIARNHHRRTSNPKWSKRRA